MIPKVIHYCWFGGKPYPKIVKKCINSWKTHCPDYELKLWNEQNYDLRKNRWLESACSSGKWAFVSDYARLDIVFREGGIYLDTDVELLRNLDDLLQYECFLAIENGPERSINTGIGFGAIRGHRAIGEMLQEYDSLEFSESGIRDLLCPPLNTKPFLSSGYRPGAQEIQFIKGAAILPPDYFDPIDGSLSELHQTENTHGMHWKSGSWETGMTRWKTNFRLLIGLENCRRLKRFYKKKQ